MSLWRRVFTERRTIILPILVLVAASVAAFVLGVLPLQRAVANAEETALASRNTLNLARITDRAAKSTVQSKDQAIAELQKFYAEILPADYARARSLVAFWAQKQAYESRLTFKSGDWDLKEIEDSKLVRVTGKMTLTGSYADISRFLYAAETAEEFFIVEKVLLGQAGLTSPNSMQPLDIELQVATYYLRGDK